LAQRLFARGAGDDLEAVFFQVIPFKLKDGLLVVNDQYPFVTHASNLPQLVFFVPGKGKINRFLTEK